MRTRILLGLLCLSGWQSSLCVPHQYHYIANPMTWAEAQTYCRQMHTDLATVENTEELDRFKSAIPPLPNGSLVWFGMYSQIDWKWSDGYSGSGADYRRWETATDQEPDFYLGNQLCVEIGKSGNWWDENCHVSHPFICNRGTHDDPEFIYVDKNLDWFNAQKYCRENFRDLATVKNEAENRMILNLGLKSDEVWIGLYRVPNIHWSDGSVSMFSYWGSFNQLSGSNVACGAADMEREGNWRLQHCDRRYPFVCHGPVTRKQVFKVRIKVEDPSVDLNNPTVKAELLKKLQNRLGETGSRKVTLKWREQPDGKVFRKERERSRKKKCAKTEF